MSCLIKATPVERLVEAYLKRLAKTNKARKERAIIEKAAKMIGIALHDPCCAPAEEVILGRQDNFFTIQLQALLNGIDARKNRESLEHAKKALENAVYRESYNGEEVEFILNAAVDSLNPILSAIGTDVEVELTVSGNFIKKILGGTLINVTVNAENTNCNFLTVLKDDGLLAVEDVDYTCNNFDHNGCVDLTIIIEKGHTYTIIGETGGDGVTCGR